MARGDHGMIRPEGRPDEVRKMSATPDSTLANPEQLIADLQRQLAECRAERDDGLERETATTEILQVINSSPGDLAPVFDSILEKAHSLCGIAFGSLRLFENEHFRAVATHGMPEQIVSLLRKPHTMSDSGDPGGRLIAGERFYQISDLAEVVAQSASPNPRAEAAVELCGIRTLLFVPLRKENLLLGLITGGRKEVRLFSEKEIVLLENFAAQAVIAMENARLLTETREGLEQQTATAEVLQVINSSPGDLAPVFDAILEKALRLCGAAHGHVFRVEGDLGRAVAARGDPEFVAWLLQQGPVRPTPAGILYRMMEGECVVQIPDSTDTAAYRSGTAIREVIDRSGVRTTLAVALRNDNALLGAIFVNRREVRPFSDKEIALLENFAAQAVIAMENARLLTETREALEQQTATAEVLQVINSSPGDLAPVFDAMLDKAMRLCEASFGLMVTVDDAAVVTVAERDMPRAFSDFLAQHPPGVGPDTFFGRAVLGRSIVHTADMMSEAAYRNGQALAVAAVDNAGVRALLMAPLAKDDAVVGVFAIFRRQARAFSDKQIALLQNFAAQAVIAMENARLITETREALEQQTATAEVLQVINSSPGNLGPVFDAILEKARQRTGAIHGDLWTYDGECFHLVATHGEPGFSEWLREQGPLRPWAGSGIERLLKGEDYVHLDDALQHDDFRFAPEFLKQTRIAGIRTVLTVPLRRDGVVLGLITVYRREVQPFSDKQIALLQNFAAQAVIAMENARLLTETREALEQQTATAEVLQVINSSPGDLAPVFDAILEKAHTLCDTAHGSLQLWDGEKFRGVATRGFSEAMIKAVQRGYSPGPNFPSRRIVEGERVVHCVDVAEIDDPIAREGVELSGSRTMLYAALRKDDVLLGQIVSARQEVRPFSEKQIALVENFAAQAVIAMENARLLTETREALEQQTATAEVLQVINSSPGDLAPVFDAILEKAHTLCGAPLGSLVLWDGEQLYAVATRGYPQEYDALARQGFSLAPSISRLLSGQPFVQRSDFATAEAPDRDHPMRRAAYEIAGIRTVLWVPLRKDETVLGYISAQRQEVRPFTDKQIALLQNFAAQAVIAMENARLLDEIRQRQQELRVTFDNMVDGVAMFDEALHLAAWNRNFQELLRLPDELLAKRHDFDTYIRYLVERGEFGEADPETQISRLRARIGDHYSFERTRPDGTVIEVRHNPMPGGGIVLIYSDITERKRSEAEIKAARDAAEAAYRDLKAAQASLIHAEKMASLGQLTAGIAHEIKNPLNFVNNFAGLSVELLDELKETATPAISVLDNEKRAEIDETIEMLSGNLEKIAEHGRRADNIVTSMLEHSRGSSGERRSVDLNALIEEALNLAYHGGRAQDQSFNITLERDYADALAPIELVPQDITRVCLNLFGNGFYAATKRQKQRSDTSFKPTLKVSTRELGEAVEIRVRDNGIGISPEIKDKLFQPFFTTKPTGEGTGLGLSISYDIVTQQHGGTITVDSRVGEFTEFTVRLPRA
jgi:PAS domain S-box-containing protein